MAVWRRLRSSAAELNEHFGLELSRPGITLGGSDSHQWGEVEKIDHGLLTET